MRNEERRLTCRQARCVDNTLCQSVYWQVRTCQLINKSTALRLRIHPGVILRIMSTKLSLSSASPSIWRAAISSPLTGVTISPTHSWPSSTAADTPGTTETIGAKLIVDAASSMTNSPYAELDTPSVKRATTLPSKLAIIDLAQDVANELLHAGFTCLFIKFLVILFEVWLICLPESTSACIFKYTLRNILKCSLNIESPFLRFVYISITRTSLLTSYLHRWWAARGNIKGNPASQKWSIFTRNTNDLLF